MKKLIMLAIILVSRVSFGCSDFSGTFRTSENQSITHIQQTGCETMAYSGPEGTFTVPLDGKYSVIGSNQAATFYIKIILNGSQMLVSFKQELKNQVGADVVVRTYTEATHDISGEVTKKVTAVNKNGLVLKQEVFNLEKISN